jgi:hypothetical protein
VADWLRIVLQTTPDRGGLAADHAVNRRLTVADWLPIVLQTTPDRDGLAG